MRYELIYRVSGGEGLRLGKEVELSEIEWKENERMIILEKWMMKGTEDEQVSLVALIFSIKKEVKAQMLWKYSHSLFLLSSWKNCSWNPHILLKY